jgi:PAS domain S-box-containing protein
MVEKEDIRNLDLILDLIPDMICIVSQDGIIKHANHEWERWMGYSSEDLVGRAMIDYVHPEDREMTIIDFERNKGKGSAFPIVNRFQDKNGVYHWIEWCSAPALDGNSFFVTAYDITKRKSTEYSIREKEKFLHTVTQNLTEGLVVVDPTGLALDWNPAALKMHGYEKQEAEISFFETVKDYYVLQNLNRIQIPYEQWPVSRILRGEVFSDYVLILKENNSEWERIFSYAGTMVKDENGVAKVGVLTIRDVTEQKNVENALRESDERFRQMAENIPEVFWMFDNKENKLIYLSPAFEKIWGMNAKDVYHHNDRYIERILPEDRHILMDAVRQQNQGKPTFMEYRLQMQDGSIKWIWDRSSPVFNEKGKLLRTTGLVTDITERKFAEQQLQRRINELEVLFDNSLTVNSLLEPTEIAEKILKILNTKLEWHHAVFRQYDEEKDEISVLAFSHPGIRNVDITTQYDRLRDIAGKPGKGLSGWAMQHGVSILCPDVRKDDRYLEVYTGIRSGLYVPLKVGEVVIGSVTVESTMEDAFTPQDQRLLETVCAQAAVAIENAQLYQKLRQKLVEQQNVEQALRHSEEMYRMLAENMTDTVWLMDLNLNTTYVSPSSTKLWGYSQDEMNATPLDQQLTPDSFEKAMQVFKTSITPENLSQPDLEISINNVELELIRKDGATVWTENSFKLIRNNEGTPIAILGSGRDISARKTAEEALRASEEKYRSLVESSDSIITLQDADGKIHFMNDLAAKFFNVDPKEAAQNGVNGIYPREIAEENMTRVRHVIASMEGTVFESAMAGRWFRTSIQPVRDLSGKTSLALLNATDITELKTTQQELEDLNKYLERRVLERSAEVQDLYDNAPCGYHSLDTDGKFIHINSTELAWFGYRLEEMIGRPFADFLTTDSKDIHFREFPKFKKTGRVDDLLYDYIRKDGSTFSVSISSTAMYNLQGQYVMSRSTVVDVTERLKAEKELKASEERLNFLLSRTPAIIFSGYLKEKFILNYVSDSILTIMGYSPQDFIKMSDFWASRAHPDDLIFAPEFLDILQRENYLTWIGRIKNSYDVYRWYSIGMSLVRNEDNQPAEVVGFIFDITDQKKAEEARKESEAYARLLFDSSPDPIIVVKQTGEIVDINRAFEAQFGVVRNEVIGLKFQDLKLFSQQDIENVSNYAVKTINGEIQLPLELKYVHPSGELHTIEIRSYPIISSGNHMVVNTSRDITVHKQAEETLRLVNIEMEKALRMKDEFLANMSHELRTPLNAILGISESLEEQVSGPLNEKQKKYLRTISESGRHLLALINDILDLSKIESGRMKVELYKVMIDQTCQASLRMIKELAQKKEIRIDYETDGQVNYLVIDERRIKQALVNLLSNAVKFTPIGGTIGLKISGDANRNQAYLTVWDNGVGINDADIKRLFQPFIQLDSGLDREHAGTGLGLALTAQMARLHGGRVDVESKPGVGSRFTITLPWDPSLEEKTDQNKKVPQEEKIGQKSRKKSGKILLIEDTDAVILFVSDYLQSLGYSVFTAKDGSTGFAEAKSLHPDLILLDIQMPGMDGYEVTRQIREDPTLNRVPIIALTAFAMQGDRERCLKIGMDDYISKPIYLKELSKKIQDLLRKNKGERS